MKNAETMFDVRIACSILDSKPRIKWYIGAPGAFDNCRMVDNSNGKVWMSKVIKMNKDELHWVLGAANKKMIKAKTYTCFMIGRRFIVIEAEVPEDCQVVCTSAIAITAVRDPLLCRCKMIDCSVCPVKGKPFTDLEHDCILYRIDYATQNKKGDL